MESLRVACAQINAVVGDLDGNVGRIVAAYQRAVAARADLVVFPELALTGYPPEDLLLRPAFVGQASDAIAKLAREIGDATAVVGWPERADDGRLYNSAAVIRDGEIVGRYRKQHLPNYAVFDEERYFEPGDTDGPIFECRGVPFAISVCEDAWFRDGPIARQAALGARVVMNLNASPYFRGRLGDRERMLVQRARQSGVPIVYCNLVGGQDELVFDGGSLVVDAAGAVRARARQFAEDLLVCTVHTDGSVTDGRIEAPLDEVHEVYEALVLGTRDYVHKSGFADVAVSLSGGIDSALVAAIAVDAFGSEHVRVVLLPSRYSSDHSVSDALLLADRLGVEQYTIPIEPAHIAFEAMLAPLFEGHAPGTAEENVQARIRGNVMMTISNKFNWMVLTTGNKSEMATGYATLYGDMAGGYAVIKDVVKTLVFELCRHRNARAGFELIPQSIIDKPPSAELRPDQLDSDSLPDYAILDPIIEAYVEDDLSVGELVARGHDEALVRRVARMIDRNEYKRRQAAPGVRVSPKAFGKDRRLPIANGWKG